MCSCEQSCSTITTTGTSRQGRQGCSSARGQCCLLEREAVLKLALANLARAPQDCMDATEDCHLRDSSISNVAFRSWACVLGWGSSARYVCCFAILPGSIIAYEILFRPPWLLNRRDKRVWPQSHLDGIPLRPFVPLLMHPCQLASPAVLASRPTVCLSIVPLDFFFPRTTRNCEYDLVRG